MKLSTTVAAVFALAGFVPAAPTTPNEGSVDVLARQTQSVDCLENLKLLGGYELYCENLAYDCIFKKSNNTAALWSFPSCVAAATCAGGRNIYISSNCTNPAAAHTPAQVPSLDYNLYAKIVGSCAWAPNGCPITEQNYIDFLYGSITAINGTNWPGSVDAVKALFTTIKNWTKTGDTVPYLNFNDWLHYSYTTN